jgi:hypothetical protein
MSDITYETLRKRVSDDLNARRKEFGKTVEGVERHFRYLGLEKAVWHPGKIHEANIGGLVAESYLGYSRIEGKWGLIVRTVERDNESRSFVNQRVYTLGSCGNMEIVVNALRKVPDLMRLIDASIEIQTKMLIQTGSEFEKLCDPDCRFQPAGKAELESE